MFYPAKPLFDMAKLMPVSYLTGTWLAVIIKYMLLHHMLKELRTRKHNTEKKLKQKEMG
jgi:predicted membrane protein